MPDNKGVLQSVSLSDSQTSSRLIRIRNKFVQLEGIGNDHHFTLCRSSLSVYGISCLRRYRSSNIAFMEEISSQISRQPSLWSRIHSGASGITHCYRYAVFFGDGHIDRCRTGKTSLDYINFFMFSKEPVHCMRILKPIKKSEPRYSVDPAAKSQCFRFIESRRFIQKKIKAYFILVDMSCDIHHSALGSSHGESSDHLETYYLSVFHFLSVRIPSQQCVFPLPSDTRDNVFLCCILPVGSEETPNSR
ncbi:MAG: hypothetical protein BWY61_01312 [Firmicutes bacterium ADurb.Bin354]|nr:MAG: hypothetical protein BWY61_01312 [Firmicutes bacterium ADurb.Bin354]